MKPARPRNAATGPRADVAAALALFFVLAFVGLQLACTGVAREVLWGLHVPVFLPGAVAPVGWALVIVLTALAVSGRAGRLEAVVAPTERSRPWTWIAIPLVAALVFWVFRSRQDLLGDAYALVNALPYDEGLHPRQPLTMWLQDRLFATLGPLVGSDDPVATARRTVAIGSVVAGALFVGIARGLGRELVALLPPDRRGVSPDAVALLIALQGWTLLFYGYLENYTLVATVLAALLWTALRALRTAGSLALPAALFVFAVGLHLSVAAFLPVLLIAVGAHYRMHRRLRDVVVALAVVVLGGGVLHAALRAVDPEFSLLPRIASVMDLARQDQGGGGGLAYLSSARHLLDWANAQWLLGPVGVPVLLIGVAALVGADARRAAREALAVPGVWVVAGAAALTAAAHWSTVEPALGYARDWDLFAPTGVFVTCGAVFVLLRLVPGITQRRVLVVAIVLSSWHTGAWVALNTSEARSRDRFASLPLGLGRTEVVLARRHLQEGDEAGARRWLRRSLDRNPSNNNAWAMLSRLDAGAGDVDRAIVALENARDALPRKPEYHRDLVALLEREGRREDLAAALERWLTVDPDAPDRWLALARVRLQLGRDEAARDALARAVDGYRTAFARRPDAAVAVRIGDGEAGLGRMDESVAWYRRALDVDARHAVAHARLAVIARARGDADGAARHRDAARAGGLDADETARMDAAFGPGGD